jgi:ketosteroid isomerase-like protein
MRNSSFLIFVLLAGLSLLPAGAQKKTRASRPPQTDAEQQQQIEDDKASIQKLHDHDIEASLALDVPTLESLWTNDIVTMAPGAPAVVGKDANIKRLEEGVAKLKEMEIMAFDEQWQEVRVQGDWAYEWGTMSGRMHPFSGGQEIDYTYNVMRVLNRQPDGTWKIARSIYNDAAPPPKAPEPPKPVEPKKDRMKD